MFWLVLLLAGFAGLHVGLLISTQIAMVCSAVFTLVLWIVWKLKWIILGIIGIEELSGNKDEDI